MADTARSGKSSGSPRSRTTRSSKGLFQTEDLDREKFILERQRTRDLKVMEELERKLRLAKKALARKRTRIASYDSTFLVGGTVKPLDDPYKLVKDPEEAATKKKTRPALHDPGRGARFGRKEAVMGTKRILAKHMHQLKKVTGVLDKKLNTAQHRNRQMREVINGLRKEQQVYDRLFERMQVEIEDVKKSIAKAKGKIEDGYAARNQTRKEMQDLTDHLGELEVEARLEWQLQDRALAEADKTMKNPTARAGSQGGTGELSREDEERLNSVAQTSLWKIAKDRAIFDKLEKRFGVFSHAVEEIRDGTGYDDLKDLVAQVDDYEDEKFRKVKAISELMDEMEAKERAIQQMRQRFEDAEDLNARVTGSKHGDLQALTRDEDETRATLEDQQAAIQGILRDLGMLQQPIQDVFASIGCADIFAAEEARQQSIADKAARRAAAAKAAERAADEAADAAGGAAPGEESKEGDAGAPTGTTPGSTLSSPGLGRTSGSMKMYLQSPALRESVQNGVSTANIGQFVSILEQKASEIVQRYAVVVERYGDAAAAAQARVAADMATAGSVPAKPQVGRPARVKLGPSAATGAIRVSLASSALLSAIVTGDYKDEDEDEDDVRPLSFQELQGRAAKQFRSPHMVAAKQASSAAAKYLVTQQDRHARRR